MNELTHTRAVAAFRPSARKPFGTRNRMPESARSHVAQVLNERLADAMDLQQQCKLPHWNARGAKFTALNKLSDELYDSVEGYVKLLVERLTQLGGVAVRAARATFDSSEFSDRPVAIPSGEDHVKNLIWALAAFGSRVRFTHADADALGDKESALVCDEIARRVDDWLWFVESNDPAPQ